MINSDNFYRSTTAFFWATKKHPNRTPDFVSKKSVYFEEDNKYVELVSSKYWYTPHGVYRQSDHWGSVKSCFWDLKNAKRTLDEQVGFCPWEKFNSPSIKNNDIVSAKKLIFVCATIESCVKDLLSENIMDKFEELQLRSIKTVKNSYISTSEWKFIISIFEKYRSKDEE